MQVRPQKTGSMKEYDIMIQGIIQDAFIYPNTVKPVLCYRSCTSLTYPMLAAARLVKCVYPGGLKWCKVQPQTCLVLINEWLNHAANGPVFVFTKIHAGIILLPLTPTAVSLSHINHVRFIRHKYKISQISHMKAFKFCLLMTVADFKYHLLLGSQRWTRCSR